MKNVRQLRKSEQSPKRVFGSRFFIPVFLTFILYPLAFSLSAHAAKIHPDAGSTSAAFLKIGAGARAVSMGGAFTAVAGDPYAVFWNPAGLAVLKDRHASFTHNEYFQELGQEMLVYTMEGEKLRFLRSPALKKGTWALGLNYFHTPKDLERRSGRYESDPLYPVSPVEGTFRAYDLAFSLGYGYAYNADTGVGGAVKFISQTIDDESGSTAALDLGVTRSFNWLGGRLFTAGAAVQNMGPGVKFVSRRYDLPLTLRAGLSHRIPETGALLSFDVSKPVDNYPFFALGLEQQLAARLALRAGYRYRLHGNELGAWSGFSAGMGLALERLSFDYAFTPFGNMGNSHRFSISFRFGGKERPKLRTVRDTVPASERLTAARLHAYAVTAMALRLSPSGVQYRLDGISPDSPAPNLSFRILTRGEPPAAFIVAEGELPEKLSATLPGGLKVRSSLQLVDVPGNIQGEITFRLESKRTAEPVKIVFLYRTLDGWERGKLELKNVDAEFAWFEAVVPQSTHYVIAAFDP
ncbi:MAG: hypothetical protein FD189_448 [Elusimicrobia bacterium]|nr:MAG: hypothetical protein FD154_517 [Elusimicrobiota bacterium]KAF0157673.1 MAG: hypothetical protein FD189_448 [Elusimicrobiota bacterium]